MDDIGVGITDMSQIVRYVLEYKLIYEIRLKSS
jgi:hypothetical protein